jgi:Zn-dependent metalloprotease
VLALVATGCQTTIEGADDDTKPVTLVVSETWVQTHQDSSGGGAASGEVRARIAALQDGIDRLRGETHTGWTGRQDDVTGFLGDLSGGSWPGEPSAFMDDHGPTLFGVDSSSLRFEDPDTETVPNVTTTRATQAVGDVPVLDATLVFSGRGSSSHTDALRVTGVRGRVFPGLTVATTPTLTPEQASAAAAEAAGGSADGAARLVVLPTGTGVLAWEVVVVAATTDATSAGLYYVDATTGTIVEVRPVSADFSPPVPARRGTASGVEPDVNSVEVTGKDALGRDRTAYGLQTAEGVELTDTTTEAWDAATRRGAVQTFDASAIKNVGELPGRLVTSPSTTITNPDAIAAQSFSHSIVAYWESLGRDSWDDAGGPLLSSVNFGPENFCNAFFAAYLRQPQMVYGNPCRLQGQQQTGSFVEPDVAAHEVTHGVTATTAGLLYTGQSGALNESFSDYFGNVIGNLIHGTDSAALGEDICTGFTAPTLYCPVNPEGELSFRYMLNGADFDDYLRILNPGERLRLLLNYKQDFGGVHDNSAIWNNALWTIRTRLAQIDGQPGNTSELAHSFDRAVYGALATRLTPTSGFIEARAGVEQVIIDSQLDPVVLRTAREVFDASKICPGCPATIELAGDAVSTSPQTQLHPSISGDRVVWLDLSATSEYEGHAASTQLGGGSGGTQLSASSNVWEVVFAGDAILTLDSRREVTRIDPSGATTVLDSVPDAEYTQAAGFAGSDAGGAWLSQGDTVKYVDATGQVFQADVEGLQGDTVIAVAAGGGTVAVGTDQGKVYVWSPGSGGFRRVGQVDGAVITLATYGGNVFLVQDDQQSVLINTAGQAFQVTDRAVPFGAAMTDEYVVFVEATRRIQSDVLPAAVSYPDTDLFLLSLGTGKIYNLHDVPAQQGFPSLSGRQLVWQDATFGGDDVFTAAVPGGL